MGGEAAEIALNRVALPDAPVLGLRETRESHYARHMTLDQPNASPAPADWYDFQGRQRWWDGASWTENWGPTAAPNSVVVVQQRQGTNHILHLLLSVVTFGLWIPVWVIVATVNSLRAPFSR
jgi:hypothetical protein